MNLHHWGDADGRGRPRRRWLGVVTVVLTALVVAATAGPAGAAGTAQGQAATKVRPDLKRSLANHPSSLADVVVRLQAGTDPSTVGALARALGSRQHWSVIPGFRARLTAAQVTGLDADPAVASLDVVHSVHATLATARKWFGVDAAQAAGYTGAAGDVAHPVSNVAVLDTGIDDSNPELAGSKVVHFEDCEGTCTAVSPFDDNGHGTHVSGIVAAKGVNAALKGVAPSAGLVGIKILDKNGDGFDTDIISALDWVATNRTTYQIGVASLSLGGGCSPCDGTDALSVAIDNLWADGVVVAVAAGNEGPGRRTVGSPAVAHHVISVGAMSDVTPGPSGFSDSPDAGFYLAPFSSRGPTSDGRTKPEISAPGVAITSTCSHDVAASNAHGDPCPSASTQSITLSGTSMATPFVAGVLALMRAANKDLTPDQLLAILKSTAVPWGSAAPNNEYGAGRLDAAAAVAAAASAPIAGPAVPPHAHVAGSLATADDSTCWQFTVDGTFPSMAATLVLSGNGGTTNDLDLYLRKMDGTLIDSSTTAARQELVAANALPSGQYRLVVVDFAGVSGYDLDVSNASATTACSAMAFTAVDAGPSPASAQSGYTDGPVTVSLASTSMPSPTAWLVTVDDANPASPTPPAPDDPRWTSMGITAFDLAAAAGSDGAHKLYPWLKDASNNVSPAGDAATSALTLYLDRSNPAVTVSQPSAGTYRSRQALTPTWSTTGTLANATASVSYVTGSSSSLATGKPPSGTLAWKAPDTAASAAHIRVVVTSPGGHVGTSDSPAFNVRGLGGYWLDNLGGVHRYGSAPALDESHRWTFPIARGLAMTSDMSGGYVLDGYGGLHGFAVGGGSVPPAIVGAPYFRNFDIARDVVLVPGAPGQGYVLDGFGGVHSVGGAPAVHGTPYFGWDIARKLVVLPSGTGGYVLDGFGGVHPFAIGAPGTPAPPGVTSGPYFGFDIARSLVVASDGQTGFTLDGYGGIHGLRFAGSTHSAAVPSVGSYWSGWDIARGLTLLPDDSGGYMLDGYGGVHPFTLAGGTLVPGLSSTGYVGADVARAVIAQ